MPVIKSSKAIVRKNSTGSEFTRRRINLIEGSNVTLTVADDGTDNEVDVTIAASGGASMDVYEAGSSVVASATRLDFKDQNVENPSGTIASVYQNLNTVCDGRLTLTTAVPVTTSDVSSAGTIYYTPHLGNNISIYDGTRWVRYTFTEKSLALTVTSGSNYDVFAYDVAGVVTLILGPAWTSNTSRGTGAGTTELELKDGVLTNKVAISSGPSANCGRYLGTIRASGSNVTEDSVTKRFVWNMYNRVEKHVTKVDSTASWTYTTATWRASRADNANRVEYVCGQAEDLVKIENRSYNHNTNAERAVGIGVDSTSSNSAQVYGSYSTVHIPDICIYYGFPGLGYHYLQALEISQAAGTTTFYGTGAGGINKGGLLGILLC